MTFDADNFIAAMEPPQFKAKGKTYTGRLLSQREFELLRPKFTSWMNGEFEDPEAEIRNFFKDLGFKDDAIDIIFEWPPAAIQGALIDFFLAHSRTPTPSPIPTNLPTNGSSSQPGDAASPPA